MIVPSNNEQVVARFTVDLSDTQKTSFFILKTYLLTHVETISYAVYTTENNQLDIEPLEGTTVQLPLDGLNVDDKKIIQDVLDICSNILNT